jgi:hypothetical protein
MADTSRPSGPSRRNLLKAAGAATAVTATPLAAVTAPDAQALRASPDQRAQRYQETDHVRKFYETNRR